MGRCGFRLRKTFEQIDWIQRGKMGCESKASMRMSPKLDGCWTSQEAEDFRRSHIYRVKKCVYGILVSPFVCLLLHTIHVCRMSLSHRILSLWLTHLHVLCCAALSKQNAPPKTASRRKSLPSMLMANKHDSVATHDAYQTLFEVSLVIWFHSSFNRFERDRVTFDTLTVILATWIDYCQNIIRFWFFWLWWFVNFEKLN